MDEKIKKYLFDVVEAIEYIESVLPEIKGFNDYITNKFYKPAFERKKSIIGEAINKIVNLYPEIPIKNKEKIIGLRNRIIHAYDAVDDAFIWEIVKKHIPVLKEDIRKLLNN
ncbi:DUF86 domain-containing protein [Bacteroidota bacterium]